MYVLSFIIKSKGIITGKWSNNYAEDLTGAAEANGDCCCSS